MMDGLMKQVQALQAENAELKEALKRKHAENHDLMAELAGIEQRAMGTISSIMRRWNGECKDLHKKIQSLVNHCPDDKCQVCSVIICEHQDPQHFSNDGCPSCIAAQAEDEENDLDDDDDDGDEDVTIVGVH